MELKIDPKYENLVPALSDSEFALLEENILKDGCLYPIIVWQKKTIVDGHNRYKICRKHGINFATKQVPVERKEDIEDWIDRHHIGRRSLDPKTLKLMRGRVYERTKARQGGDGSNQYKQRGQNVPFAKSSETLAKEFGVNPRTMKRDGELWREAEPILRENPIMPYKKLYDLAKEVLKKKKKEATTSKTKPESKKAEAQKQPKKSKEKNKEVQHGKEEAVTLTPEEEEMFNGNHDKTELYEMLGIGKNEDAVRYARLATYQLNRMMFNEHDVEEAVYFMIDYMLEKEMSTKEQIINYLKKKVE